MTPLNSIDLRRAAALVAVAIAAGLSLPTMAMPRGAGMAPMMGHGMHGMNHMLDRVDASAEQRNQIEQITAAARTDLRAQHEAGADLRAQAATLFSQPSVDAHAVEVLRQQMLAEHDRASQRMMQAMLEVSRVLTPEQRQQMAEMMKSRSKGQGDRKHRRGDQRHGAADR